MDSFSKIDQGAHCGACGNNPLPAPTRAQCDAGNYKKGRLTVHGMKIAIENPRGSLRHWHAPDGTSGTNLAKFHYGYFEGVEGADGDGLDVHIGPWPEGTTVFVINQVIDGKFDEHKVMLCFPDKRTAEAGYMSNYQAGWQGLGSIVECSLSQFKWWLAYGNKKKPLTQDQLPYEEKSMDKVIWDSANQPVGSTLAQVLYNIRAHDGNDGLMFDSLSMSDILADADGVLAMDALVIPFAKIEPRMAILQKVMDRAGHEVKVLAMQISDPFTQRGTTNVAVIYELSDGQTVSIFFHNPDTTPKKITPADDLISWKWMLNKKDVTIAVAPERGHDLNVRTVAARIMLLAEKNSARFAQANSKRAERMQTIEGLKTELETKEKTLESLIDQIEVAEMELENRPAKAPESNIPTDDQNAELDAHANSLLEQLAPLTDDQLRMVAATSPLNIGGLFKADRERVMQRLMDNHPDDIEAALTKWKEMSAAPAIDPTSAEGYEKVMFNEELQLRYQDMLDAFFQERIVAVRNAMRELGWDGERNGLLSKNGITATFNFKHVGGGRNVVGYWIALNNYSKSEDRDDLSMSVEEFAKYIDDQLPKAAPVEEPAATGNPGGLTDAEMVVLIAAVSYKSAFRLKNAMYDAEITEEAYYEALESLNTDGKYLKRSAVTEAGRALVQSFMPGEVGNATKLKAFKGKFATAKFDPTEIDTVEGMRALGVAEITDVGSENIYMEKDGKQYYAKVYNTEAYGVGTHDFSNDTAFAPADAPVVAPAVTDITYRAVDDLFTAFYPNTPAGEEAWKKIAEQTEGTGKVLHQHVESTVSQLREAGYTVAEGGPADKLPDMSADELAAELTAEPEAAPAISLDSLKAVVADQSLVPFDVDAGDSRWLVMNAPRPLVGDMIEDNGEFITGRHFALIDLTDKGAALAIAENARNGAVAVFVASKETQIAMALHTTGEYQSAYMEMPEGERTDAMRMFIDKLKTGSYSYGELKELAAKGMPAAPAAEPTPEPAAAPAPEPETPDAKSQAMTFLQGVIDGTENMDGSDFPARLSALHKEFSGEADVLDLFKRAVKAYSAYAIGKANAALAK